MELELVRTYFPNGVNGELKLNICNTIELPWLDNKPHISCIPEGRYELVRRYSAAHKWHFLLKDVVGRELILVHPANDALRELKGCIAPVSILKAEGKGLRSRVALERLKAIVDPELKKENQVYLTIKSY